MTLQQIGPWEPMPASTSHYLHYHEDHILPSNSSYPLKPPKSRPKKRQKIDSLYLLDLHALRDKTPKKNIRSKRRSVDTVPAPVLSSKSFQHQNLPFSSYLSEMLHQEEPVCKTYRRRDPFFGIKRRARMVMPEKESESSCIFRRISDMQNPQHRTNICLPKIQISTK